MYFFNNGAGRLPTNQQKGTHSVNWTKALATFMYTGLSPKAPGTVGTLAAIPAVYFACFLGKGGYVALTLVVTVVAIFVSQLYEQQNQVHDSSEIVIDEVAGYFVAMALLPVTFKAFVLGFFIFRALDIIKPFPISYLDKNIKGGMGVVVDDLAAGLLTNIILQVLHQKWALI